MILEDWLARIDTKLDRLRRARDALLGQDEPPSVGQGVEISAKAQVIPADEESGG